MSLTLITGTPGSFKTCYAVWELARAVPGSTLEADARMTSHGISYEKGDSVARRLYSNVKGLLVDHVAIDADDLRGWHTWAQPGDVILFDEVQEEWRPRGLGVKVPPEIGALETHRHMGVDLILITQHPMLLDTNVRRLVNRHLHLRRLAKGCAMVYEWDHCSNPGMLKTSISHRLWWAKSAAYQLYKSAQLHTKPTVRFPAIALLGVLALVAAGFLVPNVYGRIKARAQGGEQVVQAQGQAGAPVAPVVAPPAVGAPGAVVGARAAVGGASGAVGSGPGYAGCAAVGPVCRCYDGGGRVVPVEASVCLAEVPQVPAADLSAVVSTSEVHRSHGVGDYASADDDVRQFMRRRREVMAQ